MATTKKTAAKTKAAAKETKAAPEAVKTNEDIVTAAVVAHRETVEAVTEASKEAVETVVKAGNDAAKKGYDEAMSKGREQVETVVKANIDAIRGLEDVIAVNEAGIEAAIAANTLFTKGMEKITGEWLGFTKATAEMQAAAVRKMFSAKTPSDVVATQADFAKDAFVGGIAESRKLQAMSVEVVETASKPVVDHFWKAGETYAAAVRTA